MIEILNTISEKIFSILALTALQNFFYILILLVIMNLLKNKSAKLLYSLSLIGIIKLILPPFIPVSLPSVDKLSLPLIFDNSILASEFDAGIIPVNAAVGTDISVKTFILSAWLLAVTAIFFTTILSYYKSSKKFRNCKRIDLSDKLEGTKGTNIFISDQIHSPFTSGWFKTKIILPKCWNEWNEQTKMSVIAHELSHMQHHDQWINLVKFAAETLNFYNPLVWILGRYFDRYREQVRDDSAVRQLNIEDSDYSRAILKIAEILKTQKAVFPYSALIGSEKQLEKRILYRLSGSKIQKNGPFYSFSVFVCLILLSMPFSFYCTQNNLIMNDPVQNAISGNNLAVNYAFTTIIRNNSTSLYLVQYSVNNEIHKSYYWDIIYGNDTNGEGTKDNPYKSLQKCRDEYEKDKLIYPNITAGLSVFTSGTMNLDNTIAYKEFRTVEFDVVQGADSELTVFDILGRKIKTLDLDKQPSSKFIFTFDGLDEDGNEVPKGIYIVTMKSGDFKQAKKIKFLK